MCTPAQNLRSLHRKHAVPAEHADRQAVFEAGGRKDRPTSAHHKLCHLPAVITGKHVNVPHKIGPCTADKKVVRITRKRRQLIAAFLQDEWSRNCSTQAVKHPCSRDRPQNESVFANHPATQPSLPFLPFSIGNAAVPCDDVNLTPPPDAASGKASEAPKKTEDPAKCRKATTV